MPWGKEKRHGQEGKGQTISSAALGNLGGKHEDGVTTILRGLNTDRPFLTMAKSMPLSCTHHPQKSSLFESITYTAPLPTPASASAPSQLAVASIEVCAITEGRGFRTQPSSLIFQGQTRAPLPWVPVAFYCLCRKSH